MRGSIHRELMSSEEKIIEEVVEIFPTYQLKNIKISFEVSEAGLSGDIVSVGLNYLQVEFDKEVTGWGVIESELLFKGNKFSLNSQAISYHQKGSKFIYKVKLSFVHFEDYNRWLVFLKVIHKTKRKNLLVKLSKFE